MTQGLDPPVYVIKTFDMDGNIILQDKVLNTEEDGLDDHELYKVIALPSMS